MDDSNNGIIVNKNTIITTQQVYENVYYTQLLEIMKLSLAFLTSQFAFRLMDLIIIQEFKDEKRFYIPLLFVLLIAIVMIGVKIFTYVKIANDKDEFIKRLTSETTETK